MSPPIFKILNKNSNWVNQFKLLNGKVVATLENLTNWIRHGFAESVLNPIFMSKMARWVLVIPSKTQPDDMRFSWMFIVPLPQLSGSARVRRTLTSQRSQKPAYRIGNSGYKTRTSCPRRELNPRSNRLLQCVHCANQLWHHPCLDVCQVIG